MGAKFTVSNNVQFIRAVDADIVTITDGVNRIDVYGVDLRGFVERERHPEFPSYGSESPPEVTHKLEISHRDWPMDSYEELVRYADSCPDVHTFVMKNSAFVELTLGFAPCLYVKVVREDAKGTYVSVGRLKVRPK